MFLHIDRASPLAAFEEALGDRPPGVTLLPRRRVRWGTYDVVGATLAGMRAALEQGCDYVSVVSGQDYPIKPVAVLRRHLDGARGAAFMLYFALPNPDWSVPEGGLWRLNRHHYRLGPFQLYLPNRFTPMVPLRQMPLGMKPFAGSNWWTLPRECVHQIVDLLERRPEVARFYRRAALPAEGLFQTILLNSPLAERVVFNDLRYIVWRQGDPHPATLDASDLEAMASSPGFIARKFDAQRDPGLLDLIDERLLGIASGRKGAGHLTA